MNSIIKGKALEELAPGNWILDGDKIIIVDGNITFTEEEFVQKCAELKYLEEINKFQQERASAYPNWATQLDYIYHNGIDAWKADIVDPVKNAYPKVEVDETELASRQAQALFDYQLEEYTKAQSRLAQYQVALGREEQTEEVVIGQEWNEETEEMADVTETRIIVSTIEPVEATVEQTTYDDEGVGTITSVENPLITKDEEERAEAQSIVDATPQEVIDAYNAL